MFDENAILKALQNFAESIKEKSSQVTSGEPEDQLRGPFEAFMEDVAKVLSYKIVCTGETKLPGRLGKPDYAIHLHKLLVGYVELKAPGIGANPSRFKGHNKKQWKRFRAIPNLIYCDGNDWGLYRVGKADRTVVRLSGDIVNDGKKAVTNKDAHELITLLLDFLQWEPIIPKEPEGLAALLAPLCRMLRDDVSEALTDEQSPLHQLATDWRQLLFPDASDEQFADAYAQTVTFALLLAQSEAMADLTLDVAVKTLSSDHNLLSRALQVLTDPGAQAEISASVNVLIRVIGAVPQGLLIGSKDPWIYFYEIFLASYDPKLRKDSGAYYTPVEVVRAQVRLIDDLLINRLGKPLGFVDRDVVTLDPAVGTGTYLLGVIEHALERVEKEQGQGAVSGQASALAKNIYGFENMVGPYAVAELRVSRALMAHGASLPQDGPGIYLTDTLESPHTKPPQLPLILRPIAEQHEKALKLKDKVPVIVCLGNPPYDRHEAADDTNKARTGGWVRWGDDGKGSAAIFKDFLNPVLEAGYGVHVKNIYNLYVYFWRWALWKVFEHETTKGPGVVSLISASSYLDGDAFVGMREHMRRVCDEIWILDLGGEGRGTRKSENVFDIKTPVAIAVAARYGLPNKDEPAKVHYAKIEGTRDEKKSQLDSIINFSILQWTDCPDEWQSPLRPAVIADYFEWPLLINIFPWQHTGVEVKRTWPIAPDKNTLKRRWRALLMTSDRREAFKETRDRKVNLNYPPLFPDNIPPKKRVTSIFGLSELDPQPQIEPYAYRSFDRQFLIADNRVGDYLRPALWQVIGKKQLYLTTLINHPLGSGPSLTVATQIPDRHHFRGSYGGKEVFPLYRDAENTESNITSGFIDCLMSALEITIDHDDLISYIYGILAHPAFTDGFSKELGTREIRVPITKISVLFNQILHIGRKLLWLHTYGQRYVPKGYKKGQIPRGSAKCTKALSDKPEEYPDLFYYNDTTKTLYVGDGQFNPVSLEIYEFEVSGLKVVKSWLNYRMKAGYGRKSSPLDDIRPERWTADFTTELLELLWVLEHTLAEYPKQADLLEKVINGPLFKASEFPKVPEPWRKPPPKHSLID